jgi:putative inorganic carbon (HCO3(-)) transporter
MAQIVIGVIFISVALVSVFSPWIGLVVAYFIAIFSPQAVWFWIFSDLRPFFIVVLPVVAGLLVEILRSSRSMVGLKNGAVFWIVILGLSCVLSRIFAPFAVSFGLNSVVDSNYIMETQLKIILIFGVTVILINKPMQITYLSSVIIVTGLYFVFWSNNQYLFGARVSRMPGPSLPDGSGAYADENMFAALFVAAMPFLWYYGWMFRTMYARALLWIAIPFLWHSIFLTGSRGGVLGLAAGTAVILFRSKKPVLYSLITIPVLLAALVLQGGEAMLNRVATISDYQGDRSATGRIEAWVVAWEMLMAYPFTGVGPGAFTRAFSDFNPGRPIQAHNTVLQLGAEYGVLGLIAILGLIWCCFRMSFRSASLLSGESWPRTHRELYFANESLLAGLSGLIVCSVFLTFQVFELFYMLLAMIVCINNCLISQGPPPSSEARAR